MHDRPRCHNPWQHPLQDWNSNPWNHLWGLYHHWYGNRGAHDRNPCGDEVELRDYGSEPFVVNIAEAAKQNENYRTALWTGQHFQVTLMSIPVGDEIGLEVHPTTDQFIRVEEGQGLVRMGSNPENLDFARRVADDFAIMVPAGTWHNVINTGDRPLKVYVIYAPPQHPFGTVQQTRAIAESESS